MLQICSKRILSSWRYRIKAVQIISNVCDLFLILLKKFLFVLMFLDYVMMCVLFVPHACLLSTEARRGLYTPRDCCYKWL